MSSPAFGDNTPIPAEYSCNGRNVPPPLRWENVPGGTQSLALVVDDPDAVGGLYVHWVVTGIPPSTSEIVDGALPAGAVVSANSGGKAAYLGPCPPAGSGVHHYRFQLYALSKPLTLAPTTPAGQATQTIAGSAIATASTVGLFSARKGRDMRSVVSPSTADTCCGRTGMLQPQLAFAFLLAASRFF